MKGLLKFPALLLGLFLFAGTTQKASAQYDDVSLQTFYDELSPYGNWINDPEYGYVWRPDVDQREFRPYYSNGRWAMTEYGNTWVSNYDWGWAPFHYGRWIYNRYNNWVWVPDTVWGPAWVSWRSGGGQYGWAPLGPSINVNINFGRPYVTPDFCWNFIPQAHIYYNNYPRYYSGRNRVYIQNTIIINNTYVRNNRTYYSGPRVDDVRRATNQNVTIYNVSRSSDRTGSRIENNSVNVYTPRPTRGSNNAQAAPREVVQGNISRERVERGGTATTQAQHGNDSRTSMSDPTRGDRNATTAQDSRRSDRGSYTPDQVRGERNVERSKNDENVSRTRGSEYQTPSRTRTIDNTASQPNRADDRNVMDRTRENVPTNTERASRGVETRTAPPSPERNQTYSTPSRSSSEARTSTPYAAPPQRSAEATPQRVERVQQSSGASTSRPSGSTSTERTTRSEGSGRPGRG